MILEDESYSVKFGDKPSVNISEDERIHTHLEIIHQQLVELNPTHLSFSQKQNRIQLLNHLQDYIHNGIFPRNYKYPNERKPNFIDERGRICVVGYLIEKSVDRELAEIINSKF